MPLTPSPRLIVTRTFRLRANNVLRTDSGPREDEAAAFAAAAAVALAAAATLFRLCRPLGRFCCSCCCKRKFRLPLSPARLPVPWLYRRPLLLLPVFLLLFFLAFVNLCLSGSNTGSRKEQGILCGTLKADEKRASADGADALRRRALLSSAAFKAAREDLPRGVCERCFCCGCPSGLAGLGARYSG